MPDLIIPTDDRAVKLLHELARTGSDQIRRLVEKSLGPVSGHGITASRPALLNLANRLGIEVPASEAVSNRASLIAWLARVPGPWLLKVDGSSSGLGVHGVATSAEALAVFDTLRNRAWHLLVAAKRLVVNLDPYWIADWLHRATPQITVQAHITGRPADLAMFCWKGEVRAAAMAEALTSAGENRPATLARLIDRPDFLAAAKTLAAELQLTGFYGLDFIIEDATDKAYLIELNPRATTLANLRLEPGRDLLGAALTALTGAPSLAPEIPAAELVAYFPNAWRWNQQDPRMAVAIQDAPWDEPGLFAEMLRPMWPDRQWLARLIEYLRGRFRQRLIQPRLPLERAAYTANEG